MISERATKVVALALAEDVGHGDATSMAAIAEDAVATARIVARSALVVSGAGAAEAVFKAVDPGCTFEVLAGDGQSVAAGSMIAIVSGRARSLLTAERTALNFLQHLSGIASLTARYVEEVAGTSARIVDTRKTVPGMRDLAKAAVRHGGGRNHRIALDDGILIKDNHVVAAGGIRAAVARARANGGYLLRVEVECDTLDQVTEALDAGADILLLDNMPLDELRRAVALCGGRAQTEASGGVNLSTVRAIAETGVDYISVGAITHSAPAADIALDFEEWVTVPPPGPRR